MRARNIKPGFFKNEELVECSFPARLLFPGLWMMADRKGRMEDRPKRIKMEIFPADNLDVAELLDELENHGLIARYEVGGKGYILLPTMVNHQRFHTNESPSVLPPHPTLENDLDEQPEKPRKKPSKTNKKSTCHHGDNHSALNAECLNAECLNAEEDIRATPEAAAAPAPISPAKPPCPHQAIAEAYNRILPSLPNVREMNESRKKKLRTLWGKSKERQSLEWWEDYFGQVAQSPFLLGEGGKDWHAGFDWLIKPANMTKVLEGQYAARPSQPQQGQMIMPQTYAQAQDAERRQIARMILSQEDGNGFVNAREKLAGSCFDALPSA
jgi:hypothetical protein